ncbi:IS3 family transposase [Nocardia sp. NBC_01730]|uniref:IS3 family transposase n=1 Tax=Nocardia sp. NBC_01730 TaxID=2975998 RepID=UPI002E15A480|nr:IS3 family transposase [Nocardia sp. NBC_01730]
MVHSRSPSQPIPAASCAAFPTTLTTTTHSPQQLGAVWYLHLHADTEGPSFISTTARHQQDSCFYITTFLSPSGHTNALMENFFSTLKTELVYRNSWRTREAAENALFGYIDCWYNTQRIQK